MATLLTRRMAAMTLSRSTGRALSRRTAVPLCSLPATEVSEQRFTTITASVSAPAPLHSSNCGAISVPSLSSSFSSATRPFSTPANAPATGDVISDSTEPSSSSRRPLSERLPAAFLRRLPKKPAPSVVARRVAKLRTYIGAEKNIRHSPWRLNLVCQFAAGQTVPEALEQLAFTQKVKAPLVAKVIKRTADLAESRDNLQLSQLEVAECFATHGTHLKRIKIMGRGRSGKKLRRHSHFRVVLREIDFPLKIALCPTVHGKKKWLEKMKVAEADAAVAMKEREEIERLEAEAEAMKAKLEEKK